MADRKRVPLPDIGDILDQPRPYFRRIIAEAKLRYRDRSTRPATVLLAVLGVLVLGGFGYWLKLSGEIPSAADLKEIRRAEATIVYTADGEELTRYHDKNRTWVPLDSISPHVTSALIATEDHRFYRHGGIDFGRTVSSLWKTAQGDRQGGSTITMQLARNAFDQIRSEPTLERKLKEYITALQIESYYSKDEILEMYLNSVPFMYGTFGIEAAARTYFQKSAHALELAEAATLIAMLKGTATYNPVRNPEASHERRNLVLNRMSRHGYLEQADLQEVQDAPTAMNFRRVSHEDNLAPYFAEHLRMQLDEWAEQNGYNLYLDGLRVYTTIDSRMQQLAEEAVESVGEELQAVADVEWSTRRSRYFSGRAADYRDVAPNVDPFGYYWQRNQDRLHSLMMRTAAFTRLTERGVAPDSALTVVAQDTALVDSLKQAAQRLETSFVAVEPANGHVRAWVGGRDFSRNKFDHVVQAKRQPGSTFKPFVYAAALEHGYGPEDLLNDQVVTYVDPQTRQTWSPRNVGQATGWPYRLRDALAYSKNTITAQLTVQLGPERVAEYARRLGIKSELHPYPSLGLGTSEVNLLELVSAYSSIASGGTRRSPVLVLRIEDRHGRVLATFAQESHQALDASTSYTLLDMMRGVVNYGTGQRMRTVFRAGGDIAGKTGTSQDGADGWFVLMHPNLVMGSWVGFSTPSVSFRSDYWGQGSHNALYVVGRFFQAAQLTADATFAPPPGYRLPQSGQFRYAAGGAYAAGEARDSEPRRSDRGYRPARGGNLSEADRLTRHERRRKGVGQKARQIRRRNNN